MAGAGRRPLDASVALKASTLGVEVAKPLTGHAALRAGFHMATYSQDGTDETSTTTEEITLRNLTALPNTHPARRTWTRSSSAR